MSRHEPPAPLVHELPRPHLTEELANRWSTRVTVLRADAGSGKTTAMSQAVRINHDDPRGVDCWLACTPADADATRLARGLRDAVGADESAASGDPAVAIADAVAARSPTAVCILLDDAHHIAEGSDGADLLRHLLAEAPSNLHLVVATRGHVPVPLARLLAAGQALIVDDRERFWFDADEQAAIREVLGGSTEAATQYDGWPALTVLAIAADQQVAQDYLFEEVLTTLDPGARRVLDTIAVFGNLERAELAASAGATDDDIGAVLALPLVLESDGRVSMHDLLRQALGTSDALDHQRVVELLLERGDAERALHEALTSGSCEDVQRVLLRAISAAVPRFPADTARRWEQLLGDDSIDMTERRLLRISAAIDTDGALEDLAEIEQHYRERGDREGWFAVLAITANVAYGVGDFVRVLAIQNELEAEDDLGGYLTAVRTGVRAVLADLGGDAEGALRHLSEIDLLELPDELRIQLTRLRVANLVTLGRPGEAIGIADAVLADAPDPRVARTPATVRWFDGDPTEVSGWNEPLASDTGGDGIERLISHSYAAHFASAIDGRSHQGPLLPLAGGVPRLVVMAAVAEAVVAVSAGQEHDAAAQLRSSLSELELDQPVVQLELRRFAAAPRVLAPDLLIDSVRDGPAHLRAFTIADQLTALRQGVAPSRPPALPELITTLPLVWTIEFLARSHALGCEWARGLAAAAADQFSIDIAAAAHTIPDEVVRAQASELATLLPSPPGYTTRVEVLGPFQLCRDDEVIDDPLLRRARVRQLLTSLVVERGASRDQLIEALWPEVDLDKGLRSLRTNLTHARRLLEPTLAARQPSYHLRTIGESLTLTGAGLTCDLWEFDDHVRRAAAADERSQLDEALSHYESAAALWRGDPLTDLANDHGGRIETTRRQARYAAVRGSELALARGRLDTARSLADRALTIDPYDATGHRARLAIELAAGSVDALRTALEQLDGALDEGVIHLDHDTAMVVRRARDASEARSVS